MYQLSEPTTSVRFYPDAIPEELRERDQWVTWRYERREGKPTKVPYTPHGYRASHSNPDTWRPFGQVLRAYVKRSNFAGIGYVFSEDDPFCGVDFDAVRNPATGEIKPETVERLTRLDSYSEISPSLEGVKVWIRGTKPPGRHKKPGLEVYDRKRFFTMTGAFVPLASLSIEPRQAELEALLEQEFPRPQRLSRFQRPYTGPTRDLGEILEAGEVEVFREIPDSTAEHVFGVRCPWWREHSGNDVSGTRVGQYPSGKTFFICEHAHCARRGWREFYRKIAPKPTIVINLEGYAGSPLKVVIERD